MSPLHALLIGTLASCATATGGATRPATPAGPPPGEAPPATTVEATAPPQPDPGGTAPVVPENGTLDRATADPTLVPVVQTSVAPSPASPTAKPFGTPVMKRGAVEVSGSGHPATIVTRYLNKRTASFLRCYQQAVLGRPTVAGSTTLTFEIGGDGKVSHAATTGGLDPELEHCLAGVAAAIEFPKAARAITRVRYPLAFELTRS